MESSPFVRGPAPPPTVGAARLIEKQRGQKLSPTIQKRVVGHDRLSPAAVAPFCAVTYLSIRGTCPDSCVHKDNGCYAQAGHPAVQRLIRNLDEAARGHSGDEIIEEEARLIEATAHRLRRKGIRGLDLRLHVAGDVVTEWSARRLGAAASLWVRLVGGRVWTYTHRWREISRAAWGTDVSVLASVEDASDIELARERGYACAIVVDHFPRGHKQFSLAEAHAAIVPCLAEARDGTTCVQCRVCFDDDRLLDRCLAIAFEKHGRDAKKVHAAPAGLVSLRLAKDGRSATTTRQLAGRRRNNSHEALLFDPKTALLNQAGERRG